ncbi:MAG: tetratricopeptide repeat protein [Verrucomicrobia bacterium]|nr:tetratricopeptide repeat protein [Verrucomicrobiota bacterium]
MRNSDSPAPENQTQDVQAALTAALAHQRAGDWVRAAEICERVVALRPDHVEALHLLALATLNSGDAGRAAQLLKKAAALKANNATILLNLGNALSACGNFVEAVSVYRHTLAIEPQASDAHFNLGLALRKLGKPGEAMTCFRNVIGFNPSHSQTLGEAHFHLGCCLWELKRTKEAILAYRRALEAGASFRELHGNLGLALQEAGRFEEAVSAYRCAIGFKPDILEVRLNLALAEEQCGLSEDAIRDYDVALRLDPKCRQAHWARCLALPIVYQDEKQLDAYAARWSEGIDCLLNEVRSKPLADPTQALSLLSWKTNFYLHYQGKDHTRLQAKYSQLLSELAAIAFPGLTRRIPRRARVAEDKIRVAFVSSYFVRHTMAKLFGGWLRELDRAKFDVHAVGLAAGPDAEPVDIGRDGCWHNLGALPARRVMEWMRDQRFDVIVYLDIGMHFRTQPLAALRLAPVQCCAWGHPVTSGLPTIDYFLSSELMEPENGESHYTEKLIPLPNLSICYRFPKAQDLHSPVESGRDRVHYFCSQSLFKLLPQFDEIYPRIALRVRNADFRFIRHPSTGVTQTFLNRLRGAFSRQGLSAEHYVRFCPRLSEEGFFQATQEATVLLDSLLWSGGNSSLEALACDKPIVTRPGPLMRGRHTYGMLRRAGIEELIAGDVEEYIEIAVRLGLDVKWRAAVTERIRSQKSVVYDDRAPVRALEQFLLSHA